MDLIHLEISSVATSFIKLLSCSNCVLVSLPRFVSPILLLDLNYELNMTCSDLKLDLSVMFTLDLSFYA